MTHHPQPVIGLDGVAAAETALSHIDGERGLLIVAGRKIDELAGETDFPSLAARLLSVAMDEDSDPKQLGEDMAAARPRAHERLPDLLAMTKGMPPVSGFRAALAGLRPEPGLPHEAAILGALPVLAAALGRQAQGDAPVSPSPELGHAADMLRMLRGSAPSEAEAKALDTYLVTVADHSMNASTFAARVVASTGADLFMSTTAAYCALTGPLHGGAPEPVLEMLDAIGSGENIAPWIDAALARGERLMGFGHRIYRVRDPRADVLKRASESLGRSETELGLAAEVEAYARRALARAKPDRALDTNVEFYTAILLDALGIPRQLFTPVFAMARAAGWIAHALEQKRKGRLLRPAAAYVGPMPEG